MCEHVKASIRNMHRSVLKESWFEKKNEEMILIKGESTSCSSSNHRGSSGAAGAARARAR